MKRYLAAVAWFAGAVLAWAQGDILSLKAAFRQGRTEDLLQRLISYREMIPENSSFEVDYMILTTLAGIPRFKDAACDFTRSVESSYQPPWRFDNRDVPLDQVQHRICPPPPQTSPGVYTTFSRRVVDKAALLKKVQQDLRAAPPPPAATSGVYNMVHDGWKGQLELRGASGVYTGSDGRRYPVRVTSPPGYHIVFIVVGLGGENADGLGGQKFDGYLMTQTRDAIAGVTWWQGQPFGFYAVRR